MNSTKKSPVVPIMFGEKMKKNLEKIARNEGRTFAGQCRYFLQKCVEAYLKSSVTILLLAVALLVGCGNQTIIQPERAPGYNIVVVEIPDSLCVGLGYGAVWQGKITLSFVDKMFGVQGDTVRVLAIPDTFKVLYETCSSLTYDCEMCDAGYISVPGNEKDSIKIANGLIWKLKS